MRALRAVAYLTNALQVSLIEGEQFAAARLVVSAPMGASLAGLCVSTSTGGDDSPTLPFAAPILFRLAPHRRCRRVLGLDPMA
jgi:hypothetical protein